MGIFNWIKNIKRERIFTTMKIKSLEMQISAKNAELHQMDEQLKNQATSLARRDRQMRDVITANHVLGDLIGQRDREIAELRKAHADCDGSDVAKLRNQINYLVGMTRYLNRKLFVARVAKSKLQARVRRLGGKTHKLCRS